MVITPTISYPHFQVSKILSSCIREEHLTNTSLSDLWKAYTQLGLGSTKVDWETVLCPGESAPVNAAWLEMIATKKSVTIHTRVNTPWRAPELDAFGNEQWTESFLLLSMYPDLDDDDGEVSTVMSCITDIR